MEENMNNQKLYQVTFVQPDKTGKYQEFSTLVLANSEIEAKAFAMVENPRAEELIATLLSNQ